MGIEKYQDLASGTFNRLSNQRLTLQTDQHGRSSIRAGRKWYGKVVNWFKVSDQTQPGRTDANRAIKQDLYRELSAAVGQHIADSTMESVLGTHWRTSGKSLERHHVAKVLDESRQIRQLAMRQNLDRANQIGNALAPANRQLESLGWSDQRGVGQRFEDSELDRFVDRFQNLPRSPELNKRLFDRFLANVTRHPAYQQRVLSKTELSDIALTTTRQVYREVQQTFDSEHPGLSAHLQDHGPEDVPRGPHSIAWLRERLGNDQPPMAPGLHLAVDGAFNQLHATRELLGAPSFDIDRLPQDLDDITKLRQAILQTRLQLNQLVDEAGDDELDDETTSLIDALHQDLQCAEDHLVARREMLAQTVRADPFSQKNLAYKRLMLAHAGRLAIEQAIERNGRIPQNTARHMLGRANRREQRALQAWQQASPTTRVPKDQVSDSGFYAAEKDERAFVNRVLRGGGVATPNDDQWHTAQSTALNTEQQWNRIERDIVFHRDGKTQKATSIIDPAIKLQGSYAKKQLDQAGLQGISAHTHIDHHDDSEQGLRLRKIPKNLQHSKLTVDGRTKVDMIRHGVLANQDQAKSVVSTAIGSDPVLRDLVLDRLDDDNDQPIDFDFSNVNLMTPWPFSGRRRLQDAHLQALTALGDGQQPVSIPFVDRNGETRNIRVNLRVSAVGIPVNIGVGRLGRMSRTWAHLEDSNRRGLQNLIGDLGDPSQGLAGSARGTRVGGMIGDIMSKLDQRIEQGGNPQTLAELKTLRANLQEAADIVRDHWCTADFKHNDGDRYKFAMAVLFADSLAKQAHGALRLSGQGKGFGVSQGCMSNKDRGGNADALIKSLNMAAGDAFKLLRHSTEKQNPRELVALMEKLPPEDAKNLLMLGLLHSGQFEAQQLQTLVMGSKNAGELMTAITQDPEALQLLKGLSSETSA